MNRQSRFLRAVPAVFLALSCAPRLASAAEIYVLDARIEREGVSSVSPTFIVTSGERALLSFEGERDLEVAMTISPRAAASDDGDAFDLKVELVEGVQLDSTTVPVSLAETETLELAGRTIDVLIRVQEPIGQPVDAAAEAPATDAPANATVPAGGTDGG